MVFDVTIEERGIIYMCSLMSREGDSGSYFAVDVRQPSAGSTLSFQVHNLQLHREGGSFRFRNIPAGTSPDILALEPALSDFLLAPGRYDHQSEAILPDTQ